MGSDASVRRRIKGVWGTSSKFATDAAGVVFCIPYTHMNDVRGSDLTQPSTSAAPYGDKYELIAALTRVRGILFGEDFQQFLRGGATQRYSLTTYLDLFCYQPREYRYNHLDMHQFVPLNAAFPPPHTLAPPCCFGHAISSEGVAWPTSLAQLLMFVWFLQQYRDAVQKARSPAASPAEGFQVP